MVSMVLGTVEAGAILANRFKIRGKIYVALLKGSEVIAGFYYKD